MIRQRWSSVCVAVWLVGCVALFVPTVSHAQGAPQASKTDAPLIVDGVVRQIFASSAPSRHDILIEIDVRRSEARMLGAGSPRPHFPAPDEFVYVHLSPEPEATSRLRLRTGKKRIPEEGQSVRAYLKPRAAGGWEDALPDWFESNNDIADKAATDEPAKKFETQTLLGMTIETVRVENRTALRVLSVTRGGAAQSAGLEVGDLIAGVNDAAIVKADELTALAALGEKFSLLVVDVNSGKIARVELDPKSKPTDAPVADKAPTPAPATVSLGMSAESVTLGTRSALKVIRVDPAGVAAKAGLEPGDLVVAANGVPTTNVEQLLSALRKSGQVLNLTVRDARTGRDTDVAVNLVTTKTAPAKEVESPITQAPGKLGAVTELAFHDSDFAVKVTEVTPGSAAARAGLRPGVIITAANGKPVLHPNDLNDLARTSMGALKLTLIDPVNGRKSTVDVNLGK